MLRTILMLLPVFVMALASVGHSEAIDHARRRGPVPMELELVREFDPGLSEFPKGIAFDRYGGVYVGMQMLGQVRKLARDGSEEIIATIPFDGPPGTGFLPAIALVEGWIGARNAIYASFVDGHTGAATGVYKISRDGTLSRVPGSEAISFGNGMTADRRGNVYVSNSTTGSIWRIRHDSGAVELWAQDPLLEGDGSLGFGVPLGAGGLALDGRSLLVTVEEKARVVRIDIDRDGSAGNVSVVVEDSSLYMTEGVALGRDRSIYISSWYNSTLSVLDRRGNLSVIADSEDGLLGPVTLAFGKGLHSRYLYIVNQSGFIFPDPKPALYRIKVGP
ncbi:MAG: hypothetical protein R3B97_10970 [Dehalococcoidia bacterium]|nr:hypothetical protein [Dehalococcoidia bacterium]MCB9484472.1 hypothetical protein [Thermoflexaceae bacterium]